MDTQFDDLPIEILHLIAANDVQVYRALLAAPRFARSVTTPKNYIKLFGYSVVTGSGYEYWYRNGELYYTRFPNGTKNWYPNFKKYGYRYVIIEHWSGDIEYNLFDRKHRIPDDGEPVGPAVEKADGTKEWWWHGSLHRNQIYSSDGPAAERPGGHKEWWQHGLLHRRSYNNKPAGPAIVMADGSKYWYSDGVYTGNFSRAPAF
jgi:hypothetical protein